MPALLIKDEIYGNTPTVEDTGWLTTDTGSAGFSVRYRKVGKTVHLRRGVNGTIEANTWKYVAVLPEEYAPKEVLEFNASIENQTFIIKIETSGLIAYYSSNTYNYIPVYEVSYLLG